MIEPFFESLLSGNIAGPAFAIADCHNERIRPNALRHKLVSDKRFTRQDYNLSRAQIQTGQVDWLAPFDPIQ